MKNLPNGSLKASVKIPKAPPPDYSPILEMQLKALGLPFPEKEYQFHKPRKWRFDFAWPRYMLALEVEGGIWMKRGGAHRHPLNFLLDLDKYNQAAIDGWRIIRVTPDMLTTEDGRAALWVEQALKMEFIQDVEEWLTQMDRNRDAARPALALDEGDIVVRTDGERETGLGEGPDKDPEAVGESLPQVS